MVNANYETNNRIYTVCCDIIRQKYLQSFNHGLLHSAFAQVDCTNQIKKWDLQIWRFISIDEFG